MKYDRSFFDTPVDRMGTNCEKWDARRRREGSDLLPMWVADMDFRCADEIVLIIFPRPIGMAGNGKSLIEPFD